MDPMRDGHARSKPAWAHRVLRKAEDAEALDGPATGLKRALEGVAGRRVTRQLRGHGLGHPLHPLAVTVPIGAWLCSAAFDLLPDGRDTARRLIATGLLTAPAAIVLGLADYTGLDVRQRRVGLVHAAANAAATALFGASYLARRRGGSGRLLAALGLAATSAGGALGGHLAYAQGAGVFRWQPLDDLAPGELAGEDPTAPRNPA
ncbi:DUF2231 domain-containing protein [Amycolatopsis rifamycinica]|uniref:Membrane protein n=1 Tax=Amycolatopsis rifamycinica TaxID=287986 RepID=A0A066TQ10_9PSEU|nr:DUF2231 domain-containing protein [Amycolatopsis rifamycinica]KDN17201.1 membrane protein [Amycolatopsis rifamycinica]